MLGRASASTTLDTYADLFEDDQVAVANGLDAANKSGSSINAGAD